MYKFWMCLVDKTPSCSVQHLSKGDAKREAERLVNLPANAGKGVVLLEAVEYCKHPIWPVIWKEL